MKRVYFEICIETTIPMPSARHGSQTISERDLYNVRNAE